MRLELMVCPTNTRFKVVTSLGRVTNAKIIISNSYFTICVCDDCTKVVTFECHFRRVFLRQYGPHHLVVFPVRFGYQPLHESRQEEQSSKLVEKGRHHTSPMSDIHSFILAGFMAV